MRIKRSWRATELCLTIHGPTSRSHEKPTRFANCKPALVSVVPSVEYGSTNCTAAPLFCFIHSRHGSGIGEVSGVSAAMTRARKDLQTDLFQSYLRQQGWTNKALEQSKTFKLPNGVKCQRSISLRALYASCTQEVGKVCRMNGVIAVAIYFALSSAEGSSTGLERHCRQCTTSCTLKAVSAPVRAGFQTLLQQFSVVCKELYEKLSLGQ